MQLSFIVQLPQILEPSRFYGGRSRSHNAGFIEEDIIPNYEQDEDMIAVNFRKKKSKADKYSDIFVISM